ncbi:MAG: PhoU domain-containing protein [Candidatus Omnitrophota bacterium]|jgi:phosphate:Na+ symporter
MKIDEIKNKTLSMADKVCSMINLIKKGFMENKLEPLATAMKEESDINQMEKSITGDILALAAASKDEKEKRVLIIYQQVVEMLERMGDEAANLVERIEIKVHEKLLFSDLGVEQFNETYDAMRRSVEMVKDFLSKQDASLKEKVIDNGFHVKDLVERYRNEHTGRVIKGLCTPIAANMFFDMLDFTGNLARHSSSIVKLLG